LKLGIEEIIKATDGKILLNKCNFGKIGISTDSRNIKEDEIFLPLNGEKFNGHDFINNALKLGSMGYFVDKEHADKALIYYNPTRLIISVEDTLEAYLKIAKYVRNKINPKVVAVTGSSGKTTVKEMIYSVLSSKYKTHKSHLNHNNEVGLCQTLLNMPEDTEYLVLEMGMRGLGEIELLSKYAQPDYAVITNVGYSHIGRLGSIENIAKAKCEIVKHMNPEGILISYEDDLIKKYCSPKIKTFFYGKNYEISKMTECTTAFTYNKDKYQIPVSGEFNVINSIAAIEIGKLAKISAKKINEGLLNYVPVGERGKIVNLDNNIKILSDCYNANPDSMKAYIDSVLSIYKDSQITLVLGDMAELGDFEDSMHKELGAFLSEKNFFRLITVGEKAKLIAKSIKNKDISIKSFKKNDEAANYLRENMVADSVIMLKASRCMKLEEIQESLQKVST